MSCLTRCNPVNCSMPGLSVLHYIPEFAQTHVHWISDAIQPSHWVCPSSCPLNQWCHPTISSSVTFFFCPQSFPASGSFPMSWLFALGGQQIGASASTSVFPVSSQGWFPLRLTGFISLLSKGLSRVFSSTTVQKHQFFSALPSLRSNSHICTWLLEKPWLYYKDLCQ